MVKTNGEDTEKRMEGVGDIKTLPAVLKINANKILGVLPSGFDEDEKKDMVKAMIYLSVKAYEEMPALRNCTPASLLKAIMDAATLGMIPFSMMNECAIIPYGNIAQFQIMYRGIYKLAMNTGMFKDIRMDIVRKEDKFNYEKGFDVKLIHIPSQKPIADREIIFFYGLYELKDGGKDFVIMAQKDMDAHRDKYSKQYRKAKSNKNLTTAIWHNEFEAMGLKTILIKLLKYAPKSEKLVKQLALDKVIKREIAPEQKDFTKEAENEFILERQSDVEGSGVYEEDKSKEKKIKGKVKENLEKINKEGLDEIFNMGRQLNLDQKQLTNRIKVKHKLNNLSDLTITQAGKVKKELEAGIKELKEEQDQLDKAYEENEKKKQEGGKEKLFGDEVK